MAEEEKQDQEETAAEEQTPDEEAGQQQAESEVAEAGEKAPAEDAQGEAAGASDEVAEQASEPAATGASQPGDTAADGEDVDGGVQGAEGEASGGEVSEEDVDEEVLSPKQLRKRERSRASGPARPQRSGSERATERAERRGAAAESRRRHRASRRRKRGEPGTGTPPAPREPGPKKVRQGTVVSTGGDKTITVEIAVVRRHATYEKVVRRTSKLRAHDEENEARQGDVVRVVESRPLSRTKRWRLLEVLERAPR
jgi:small subunit ribosomal protein S17